MAYQRLNLKRGDYFAHKIILPAEDEDENVIDWTTATFLAQIRANENLTSPVLAECVIDDTNVEADPPFVVLTIEAETVGDVVGTADLPAGQTVFMDFQETRDSKPRTPVSWKVKILGDVSR